MSLAFLFAGQGSQQVGMGNDLRERCADCRATFEAADDALGFPLTRLVAEGPAAELQLTANAQPAILTLSVAHARHLGSLGQVPEWVAGHSLGQYSALVVAGALEFGPALRLVRERGKLMQSSVGSNRVGMMAILGLDRDEIAAVCRSARSRGVLNIACHNAPEQTVLSGEMTALELAAELCEDAGGSTVSLAVSAPFHCELLAPMVPEFDARVRETPMRDPRIPVIDNVSAQPLTTASAVAQALVAQIMAPVLFEESLGYLFSHGVNRLVQCGPGKNLLSFARRIDPETERMTFEEAALVLGVAC